MNLYNTNNTNLKIKKNNDWLNKKYDNKKIIKKKNEKK